MANTAKFSLQYKAMIVKAIVEKSRTLHAFGIKSNTITNPAAPTTATLTASATASTLGSVANGTILFNGFPTVYATNGAEVKNSAASSQLTIPAGTVVHFVGLAGKLAGEGSSGSVKLISYIRLTDAVTNYYYEEQGTLTIPAQGYTVRHA